MGRDEWFLFLFFGFPVVLGCIGILFSRLSQSAQSFQCPQCGEKLPLTEIRPEGIQCYHCDWCVERQDVVDSPVSDEAMR